MFVDMFKYVQILQPFSHTEFKKTLYSKKQQLKNYFESLCIRKNPLKNFFISRLETVISTKVMKFFNRTD